MDYTGDTCKQGGIYRTTDCNFEIALAAGDRFPPCPQHRKAVQWVLVRPANH